MLQLYILTFSTNINTSILFNNFDFCQFDTIFFIRFTTLSMIYTCITDKVKIVYRV